MRGCLAALLLWCGTAFAQEPSPEPVPAAPPEKAPPVESWRKTGIGFAGLPAVNYNSDELLGLGAIVDLYWYDGKTAPYRSQLRLQVFATTGGAHYHRVRLDTLGLVGGKLRLTMQARFLASKVWTYCGVGGDVTCDPAVAEARADALGLRGDRREDLLRRFYQERSITPDGFLKARWKLAEEPVKAELFGGWYGMYLLPGDFTGLEPYPNSFYADAFPDGETGMLSVLEVGGMVDQRDNEPAPNKGYWVEASIRDAGPWFGSRWSYFGFNTTLRGYAPLWGPDRVVLAGRFVFDGMVGDAPSAELWRPGGFQTYTMFGGLNAGRGIRQQRYFGRVKTMLQAELRYKFVKFNLARIPIALSLLVFSDSAFIGEDWDTPLGGPILGEGAGLRIAIDENFIVRADFGFSAAEDYGMALYIDLDNVF